MNPSPLPAKLDAIVIGSGMVGVSTALELQKRGKNVAIIDPGNPLGRASYGNSGVISRAIILPMSGPDVWRHLPRYALNRTNGLRLRYSDMAAIAPWGAAFLAKCTTQAQRSSVQSLDTLVSQAKPTHLALAQELGTTSWLRDTGWLRVYKDHSSQQAAARECAYFQQYGVAHEVLNSSQIHDLEPQLKQRFAHAVFLNDAIVLPQPGRLVERAITAFQERGGHLLRGSATHIYQEGETVAVITPQGKLVANQAVLAAGTRSNALARDLGYHLPMIAGRGYHIHFPLKDEVLFKRSITNVSEGYGIGPEPGGVRLVTGIELGYPDSPPNYHQITQAVSRFSRLVGLPGIPDAAIPTKDKVWLGSRPMTPDGLPVLCQAPRHKRLYFAFGHSHIGLATGPITGRLMAQLVNGETPDISLKPFDISRFRGN